MAALRISGYVLAGGEGSRMQPADGPRLDKALLRFAGETLLERTLRTVVEVCHEATILGGPADRNERLRVFGRAIPDGMEKSGPLAGLAAALCDLHEDWLLVMPVDLPLMPVRALRALVAAATEGGAPGIAVFRALDRDQPLPVVLHRSARQVVEAALERGDRRLMPVLRDFAAGMCPRGLTVLPASGLTDEITGGVWFTNVNTPEDLRAAEELAMVSNDFARRASE